MNEDKVRLAAYYIWQSEGCPEGKEAEHWAKAMTNCCGKKTCKKSSNGNQCEEKKKSCSTKAPCKKSATVKKTSTTKSANSKTTSAKLSTSKKEFSFNKK